MGSLGLLFEKTRKTTRDGKKERMSRTLKNTIRRSLETRPPEYLARVVDEAIRERYAGRQDRLAAIDTIIAVLMDKNGAITRKRN